MTSHRRHGSGRGLLRTVTLALLGAAIGASVPARAAELLVGAAASLTNVTAEIARQFAADRLGVTVVCTFAGSGTLLRQMEQGAPLDVFASADQPTMDRAQQEGLIRPETRTAFASNRLVLVTTPRLAAAGFDLDHLRASENALLAAGNPKFVPAGRYAREALDRADLWDRLQDRLVLGSSVRQVLDYVARGEVEAGIVYATDVTVAGDRVREVGRLAIDSPIVYPVAVSRSSDQAPLALEFIEFLGSEAGRRALARHGFAPPPVGTVSYSPAPAGGSGGPPTP